MDYNQKKYYQTSGFSLIEMVVVIGSFAVLIIGIISTVLLTFRSQNKVSSNNKLEENGIRILAELRRNIFNGEAMSIVCGAGGSSVSVMNRSDKLQTNLVCRGGKIASISATTVDLNDGHVSVYGCSNFVVCQPKAGTSETAKVDFNFGLGTTTVGINSTQVFSTSVTTRN